MHLPFADRTFDAVISNHSLEHFEDLAGALGEIGRVLKPSGAVHIVVPDASTFCHRGYRWLARGGGANRARHWTPACRDAHAPHIAFVSEPQQPPRR